MSAKLYKVARPAKIGIDNKLDYGVANKAPSKPTAEKARML
jgi:hypothetical protein